MTEKFMTEKINQPRSKQQTRSLLERGDKVNSPNYKPARMIVSHGEGMWLYDIEGKAYLDFVAGIAVSSLGHAHPTLVSAISEQAGKILHVSNMFFTEPQIELMENLVDASFADRVFLCNSGAESTEAAIKLARRYQYAVRMRENQFEIVTMKKSFHGRTMGAISATGQPKYHEGFGPMVPGFKYVEFNDIAALRAVVNENTAAVMVEPIQGEGGIRESTSEYLRALREVCDEVGAVVIFDEVQTGIGRTGKRFAYEHYGVHPDIICLAKGLGGGFPIGAMMAKESVFGGWKRGSHASTFGGNPMASVAALSVLNEVFNDEFLEAVHGVGLYFQECLKPLVKRDARLKEIRGKGLMVGIACESSEFAGAIVMACREEGLLFNTAGGNTLRFVPPLICEKKDIDAFIIRFEKGLERSI